MVEEAQICRLFELIITDIEKFISIKTGDIDMIKYSNISVLLTHEFMDAVKQDKNFDLKYEGKVYQTLKLNPFGIQLLNMLIPVLNPVYYFGIQ